MRDVVQHGLLARRQRTHLRYRLVAAPQDAQQPFLGRVLAKLAVRRPGEFDATFEQCSREGKRDASPPVPERAHEFFGELALLQILANQ